MEGHQCSPVSAEWRVSGGERVPIDLIPERLLKEGQVFSGETSMTGRTDQFLVEGVDVVEEPALEGKAKVVLIRRLWFPRSASKTPGPRSLCRCSRDVLGEPGDRVPDGGGARRPHPDPPPQSGRGRPLPPGVARDVRSSFSLRGGEDRHRLLIVFLRRAPKSHLDGRGSFPESVGLHFETGYSLKMIQIAGDDRCFVDQGSRRDQKVHRRDRLSQLLQMGKETAVDRSQSVARRAEAQSRTDALDGLPLALRIVGKLRSCMELAERMHADRKLLIREPRQQGRGRAGPPAGLSQQVDKKRRVQVDQSSGAFAI